MKKARLTEDKMSYEDLAVLEIFSDDEITFALNRQNIKDKKDKNARQTQVWWWLLLWLD
jgi:hypothetical protein